MGEAKRIIKNPRIWIFILIIVLFNGFLFIREQEKRDYGMDLSLSSLQVSLEEIQRYDKETLDLDAKESYQIYLKWLKRYKNQSPDKAVESLKAKEEKLVEQIDLTMLEQQELVAIRMLLAQYQYKDDFATYLQKIQNNKNNSLSFSIFNEPDSFAWRNIMKTASEFEKIENTELTIDNNGALEAFFSYKTTDYMLLVFLLLVVISFLEERKKGLWSVIYSSCEGRCKLGIKRVIILLGTSILGTIMLYGSNLFLATSLYGGFGDLNRMIQSSKMFMKLPVQATVGEFIAQYFLARIGSAFLLSLFLWLLIAMVSNVKYTLAILAFVLGSEFLLFTYLPIQSSWNILKYFNLFTYVNLSELYINYLNINLFGYPWGIREISLLGMVPICIVGLIGNLLVSIWKKPVGMESRLYSLTVVIREWIDKICRRLHLLGFECYKLMFIQKGIFVMVFLIWMIAGHTFLNPMNVGSRQEMAARKYIIMLEGKCDEKLDEAVSVEQNKLDCSTSEYEEAKKKYQVGNMEYAEFQVYEMEYEETTVKQQGLDLVKERIKELRNLQKEKGQSLWLLNESVYNSIWGKQGEESRNIAAIIAIFSLSLLLSGCFSYERQSGMNMLLASMPRGRRILLKRKVLIAAGLSIGVGGIVYGWEAVVFFSTYMPHSMVAPIQSLKIFVNFSLPISIGTFYVILSLLRILMLFTCSCLMMLLSTVATKVETAVLLCSSVLLPSLLSEVIKILPFKFLSLSRAVSLIELISNGKMVIVCILMCSMAALCLWGITQKICPKRQKMSLFTRYLRKN